MSKIYNYLDVSKNLDKAWFLSSDIVYGECDDKKDSLKTVRIVFKNGQCYEYQDVDVEDWVTFRESDSQGKAFNLKFRKYKFVKMGVEDLDKLNDELAVRKGNGIFVDFASDQNGKWDLSISNCGGETLAEIKSIGNGEKENIVKLLSSLPILTNLKNRTNESDIKI